jgi:hypothetical protein
MNQRTTAVATCLWVLFILGGLVGCKFLRRDGDRDLLSDLTPAEAASANKMFHPKDGAIPRCSAKTPFLCDALGKGTKDARDRYSDCLAAPEVIKAACMTIAPVDFGCLDSPPPAALCRVKATSEIYERIEQQLEPNATTARELSGFDPWFGRTPSVTVYLVLDPATRAVRTIGKPSELGALYAPVHSPAKALQLLGRMSGGGQWRAAEPRGNDWNVWLLTHSSPAGCSREALVQVSALVTRSGQVRRNSDVTLQYGSERCAD